MKALSSRSVFLFGHAVRAALVSFSKAQLALADKLPGTGAWQGAPRRGAARCGEVRRGGAAQRTAARRSAARRRAAFTWIQERPISPVWKV